MFYRGKKANQNTHYYIYIQKGVNTLAPHLSFEALVNPIKKI